MEEVSEELPAGWKASEELPAGWKTMECGGGLRGAVCWLEDHGVWRRLTRSCLLAGRQGRVEEDSGELPAGCKARELLITCPLAGK